MLEKLFTLDCREKIYSLFTNQEIASIETTSTSGNKAAKEAWTRHKKILEHLFKNKPENLTAKEFTISHGGLGKLNNLRNKFIHRESYLPKKNERLLYMTSFGLEGCPDIRDFSFYVKAGCFKPIQALLATSSISERLRVASIIVGSRNNHADIVELLLSKGPISFLARKEIFRHAHESNSFEAAKVLFENGPLDNVSIDSAARSFTSSGSLEAVTYLLNNSDTFSNDDHGELLGLAATSGHQKIAAFLYDRADILYEDLHDAFHLSVNHQNLDVTKWFLEEVPLSIEAKEQALVTLSEYGDSALINHLLSTTKVTKEARGYALCAAINAGEHDIACTLASSGPIPLTELKSALQDCVQSDSTQTLFHILATSKNYPREELYKQVLKAMTKLNTSDMLYDFLSSHRIPQFLIEDSIFRATLFLNFSSVQALLNYRKITDSFAIRLRDYYIKLHRLPILQKILKETNYSRQIEPFLDSLNTNSSSQTVAPLQQNTSSEPPKKRARSK